MLGLAREALSTTTPAEEPRIEVPFGAVRVAMRMNEGWTAQPSGNALGVEVRAPTKSVTETMLAHAIDLSRPTPDLDALARGDAINVPSDLGGEEPTLIARYVWRHAFYGEPPKEFGPHADLDGVEATDDTMGRVYAAPPDEWPYVFQYEPGDHDGCTCELETTWEPEAVGTREPVGNQVLIPKPNPDEGQCARGERSRPENPSAEGRLPWLRCIH
jgi:hypothetical protein